MALPEPQSATLELEPEPEPEQPSPLSQQRLQESTPPGAAALPRSPGRAGRRAEPELRVLLTPLRAGRRLPQKRLLSGGGTGGKRLRLERPPDTGPGSPADSGSDGAGDGDGDSDGSDAGDAARDGYSQLSAYERKRLKNITENAKFFAALKLHESAARLYQIASRKQPNVTKRAKPKKAEDQPVRRRSMRLQRVEPSGIPVPEPEAEELMKANGTEKLTCDMKRYQDSLSSMVLSEENIRKVVKYRVCSMAIHPSESIVLVAAGDKSGQVGLWNVDGESAGACVFVPHSSMVSCMHFSPWHPAHLLSLSYDTLRCGDVTRAVFDEICRSEDDNFSSFDFLDDNGSTAVVGHWAGDVAVVDIRTPGMSPQLSADIGFKRTRTVHVHPVNKQYFMAAGSVDVCIYDVRYLKSKGNKPVSSLKGHTKSVASAYFSPVTGNRVVTVCADDKLRVYDTSSLSSTLAALSTVRHNCNTGRWLTRFRAVWDPKQERCFAVGSMAQPRQVQLFRDTGALLHTFCNPDCLGSVCSINVLHPTRNILVGGNSSGRLHVFKE
ncbi:hypothetical protein Q9233_009357 [Columba guinea]|nr:hypothetical protein Q9233_009357 [Columba guinea]